MKKRARARWSTKHLLRGVNLTLKFASFALAAAFAPATKGTPYLSPTPRPPHSLPTCYAHSACVENFFIFLFIFCCCFLFLLSLSATPRKDFWHKAHKKAEKLKGAWSIKRKELLHSFFLGKEKTKAKANVKSETRNETIKS